MRSLVYGGARLKRSPIKKQWVQLYLKLTLLQNKELTKVANRKMVTRDELIQHAIDEFLEREKAK